ncbi:putative Transcriptional regulator, GntR family [Vibrio nigripulchritudo SO65]|uniref:FadR/GntR family transcriptional regulator n=1 Tax=Vibrio nigripulchritudo TaxID=28173 RepID=UPI0003B23A23|nr:FadR/GntR family transcriptional regulator [Vibrio nigripulchritudo]CCN37196.1 putative Transcriptional regulator, GntR family [Vibrio nigripulchritudo AM115]CCN41440.1 putative Transcriptional regulator, GntR family [Vibrio nigripulchritudo FTn2]CCN63688.1 putative Transcriptional regulator, GntR family [Vibrio nigripulchritudo POn4]CCN76793.1 putative Transcriptional regulator, GntR family [Vibrio nigripulchritudo SO65]
MRISKSKLAIDQIVYDLLKENIQPGSFLKGENELALAMGVSRTSVRSALQTLASKGLITITPKVGSVANTPDKWNWLDHDVLRWVAEFKESDTFIPHLLEVRLMVEPNAAALAALNATGDNLAAIEKGYNLMETGLAEGDREKVRMGDMEFHKQLLVATKNPFLTSLGDALTTTMAVSFTRTLEQNMTLSQPALQDHYKVMDAVRMRNPEQARETMREIVLDATSKTVKELKASDLIR